MRGHRFWWGGKGVEKNCKMGEALPHAPPPPTMGNSEHHLVMQPLQLRGLGGKGMGLL